MEFKIILFIFVISLNGYFSGDSHGSGGRDGETAERLSYKHAEDQNKRAL